MLTIIAPKKDKIIPIFFLPVNLSFKKITAIKDIITVDNWLYIAALPAKVYL